MRLRCCLSLALLLLTQTVQAHPLAPALLDLRETAHASYVVQWRTSLLRVRGGELTPVWPADCAAEQQGEPQYFSDEAAIEQRWLLRCAQDLAGRTLRIKGLADGGINVIFQLHRADGSSAQALLGSADLEFAVPQTTQSPPVFAQYLVLGVEHLLTGFDHMLFVLGLLLLVRRPAALLATVTAFTVGHSCTLALAALGMVRINPALTELAIALSILVLATSVVPPPPLRRSWLARWPAAMAGGFGLLHGLGFAGALANVGLPQDEIPLALFAFNVGIEAGQLLLIAALLAGGLLWRRIALPQFANPALVRLLPAYLMGSLAACWCLQRAAAVWA